MIRRRLVVPSDSSIAAPHDAPQIAMGWGDARPNHWRIRGRAFGVAHPIGLPPSDEPSRVRLADCRLRPRERLACEYDVEDRWQQVVRVARILPLDAAIPTRSAPAG